MLLCFCHRLMQVLVVNYQNVFYLLSVEQKKDTQGLVVLFSQEGGRYMASEKHVSSSFSSSILIKQTHDKSTLVEDLSPADTGLS